MKKILLMLATILPILATSCTKVLTNPSIQDNTFEVGTRLYYDSNRLSYAVSLSLLSGIDGDYTIAYVIDGMKTTGITLENGSRFDSGQSIMLSKTVSAELKLPTSGKGQHKVDFVIMKAGLERKVSIEYNEDVPLIANVHVGDNYTSLTIEDTGRAGECTLSFKLDNEDFKDIMKDGVTIPSSYPVNFKETPQVVFTFPEIPAGDHTILVMAKTQYKEYTIEKSFSEPLRSSVALKTVYEPVYMSNIVQFTLAKGSKANYKVNYIIDGDPSLKLQTLTGGEFNSGSELTFEKTKAAILRLPAQQSGKLHTVSFVFERDGFQQKETITYRDRPILTAKVNIAGRTAPQLVLSTIGTKTTNLNLKFSLNGTTYREMKYNGVPLSNGTYKAEFSKNNSFNFDFSPLKVGDYHLEIEASTEFATEIISTYFTISNIEALDLSFSFSKADQKIVLTSQNNFAKENITLKFEVDMAGDIWWNPKGTKDIYHRAVNRGKTTSANQVTPSNIPNEVDGGMITTLVSEVQSEWEYTDGRNGFWDWNYDKWKWESHAEPNFVTIKIYIYGPEGYQGTTPAIINVTPMELWVPVQTWHSRNSYHHYVEPQYIICTVGGVRTGIEKTPEGIYKPLSINI